MQTLRYVICDVFTDRPLAGNQLAVFTNPGKLPESRMQELAREMNFAESVFVFPRAASGHARLRIFTPRQELAFAGHPTLGSAFVIGTSVQLDVLELETGAGVIAVRLERESARVTFGRMNQPLPRAEPFAASGDLLAALGVTRSELPVTLYDNGAQHVFVMLDSREAVAKLTPDLGRLARVAPVGVNVFAGSGTDFKTRMFHPNAGVPEDAATGSAAGPLAVHLATHGLISFDQEICIQQGEEILRPSTLYAKAVGNLDRLSRVEVGGSAVIVGRGEFHLTS